MSQKTGVPVPLLETAAKTGFNGGNQAYRLFNIKELLAAASAAFPNLTISNFRVSVDGAAGVRIKQGDDTVDAGSSTTALGSGQLIHLSPTLYGGLSTPYGLLLGSTHLSVWSSSDATSVVIQVTH